MSYLSENLEKERIYLVLNYPSQTKTFLTGIKQDLNGVYYITGFIDDASNINAHDSKIIKFNKEPAYTTFIYKGSLSGISISNKSNWHILKFPLSNNTNLYGPAILDNDNVRAVGNYSKENNIMLGCLYEGKLDGSGKWKTINPTNSIQTICHSTMGNLVVGNYLTSDIPNAKAFIYNIATNKYINIIKTGSLSITAYGIWRNSKHHYTICGGFSNRISSGLHIAYLTDFHSKRNEFTNWTSYRYNNSKDIITHFEGISYVNGKYSLAADATVDGKEVASIAYIKRKEDGTFSRKAKWTQISVPNKTTTSANSIAGTTVIGSATSDPNNIVDGFVSILI